MIFLFLLFHLNVSSFMKSNFIMTIRNIIIISNTPEIYNICGKTINGHSNKNCLSLEHIFPKSFMKNTNAAYNDLHNIYKCNNYINNLRSNYKFTDFDETPFKFTQLLNSDNYINTKEQLFIPEKESRGIIARSIMYMSYEYNLNFNKIIDKELLLDWCLRYPVSKYELHHSHLVFMKQYKKNRFIDMYNKKNYKKYIYNLFS